MTVILAPLTVLTGIFGTNFEQGLGYGLEYGVPMMLGLMLLSALATVAFLRWRGLI